MTKTNKRTASEGIYSTPLCTVVDILNEGVLCGSLNGIQFETPDEIDYSFQ